MASASILDRTDLLTLTEAARRLPGRPHRSTLWRWARRGILQPDGSRVRLEVHRLGRKTLVAPEDIDAFSAALAAGDAERHPRPAPTATAPPRSTRAQAAEAEADALGI